ncbi:MAG: chemotaxis protein CheX [Verrucomicrobiae bacterium]|nr:chemotaxis protein CheX [Verrucomicrobiae bacterium]
MSAASNVPDLRGISSRALVEVLEALVSLSAMEVRRAVGTAGGVAGPGFGATVAMCGERISGEVHLDLPESFAREASARLLGPFDATSADATQLMDFAGELANMVAGRMAASLDAAGFPCRLGTPVVGCGPGRRGSSELDAGGTQTDWICEGHRLTLEVRCILRPS